MMADLFKEVGASIGTASLVGFADDRIEWLVPVMRWLKVGNASCHDHLHTLDWISCLGSQSVEVRTYGAHTRNRLQDAVVVHGFDGQGYCRKVEFAFQQLRADLRNEGLERATILSDHALVCQSEAAVSVTLI